MRITRYTFGLFVTATTPETERAAQTLNKGTGIYRDDYICNYICQIDRSTKKRGREKDNYHRRQQKDRVYSCSSLSQHLVAVSQEFQDHERAPIGSPCS